MSEQENVEETGTPNTEVKAYSEAEVKAMLEKETSGLKDKVNELLGETKTTKQKAREAEERAKREAEERAKKENDYQSLFESSQEKAGEWEQKYNELQNTIRTEKREGAAFKVAGALASGTNAELLAKFVQERVDIDETGKTVVLNEEGKPTVSTLDDLKKELVNSGRFDSLIDGSKASGGGAAKTNSGGAGVGKDLSKMTKEQKLAYFESKRGS